MHTDLAKDEAWKGFFKSFVSGFKSPKLKGDMKKKWEGIQKQKWISQVKESENATKKKWSCCL